MKQLKNIIKKMSLTQQLLLMVVSILMFLIAFFFGVLSFSVDNFVENQMFGIVHSTQDDIIENYLLSKTGSSLFGSSESNIVHIIREGKNVPLVSTSGILDEVAPGIYPVIEDNFSKSKVGDRIDIRNFGNGRSLVSIKRINEDTSITTIMPIDYHDEFKNALLNSIVYMLIMVIGAVFLILLFWVSTIIHPLNLIRDYIEKTRNNEEAELKIDRGDEIGEVATVLVQMQNELKRQERQKEEMLQNISHDLKTPVATIKSYSEAIKDGIYPYETLEKSVDVIIEHADRLEKKVFNLLMLNRMDYMTNQEIETGQRIELEPILEQVIVSSKQLRPEINVDVKVEGSMFTGQEEPWRVVIENLLDNALRYSKTTVNIKVEDDYFSIYNDGDQVTEDKLNSFFKAYEMGEKGQFGLGLAIVNRVVTNYRYKIEAKNIDEGIVFIIRKGR